MRNLVVKWNSHERYILTNNCARRQRKRVLTTRWWSVLMHRSASAPVANDNSCAVDAASSSVKSVDELIHCQRLHAAAQIDVCQRQRRQWWRRAEAGDPRGGRRSIDWWHFDDEWISFIISLCRRFAVAHHRLHACQSTLSFARSLSLSLSLWLRTAAQWLSMMPCRHSSWAMIDNALANNGTARLLCQSTTCNLISYALLSYNQLLLSSVSSQNVSDGSAVQLENTCLLCV